MRKITPLYCRKHTLLLLQCTTVILRYPVLTWPDDGCTELAPYYVAERPRFPPVAGGTLMPKYSPRRTLQYFFDLQLALSRPTLSLNPVSSIPPPTALSCAGGFLRHQHGPRTSPLSHPTAQRQRPELMAAGDGQGTVLLLPLICAVFTDCRSRLYPRQLKNTGMPLEP